MAAEAPEYTSRIASDGVGQLAPSQYTPGQVQAQAAQQAAQSLGGLGNAVMGVAQQIEHVNRAAGLADRTTKYMEGIDQLDQDFRNDPDPTTAPQRFKEAATKLRSEATKGLGAEDSSELNLKLSRMEIGYAGSVRNAALSKQADTFTAGVDKQYDILSKRYSGASSEAEKTAAQAELNATLDKGVKDGMITAKSAEAYRQSFTKTGDSALILRQIANNPAAAQAALADPAQFAGLDPVQREQLSAQARAAADERRVQDIRQKALFNAPQAAFMAGRLTDPRQAEQIFDKAFIPQESGGNPNAQSVDGAAGIAQIMPGTARGLAKSMGLGNWDTLSDAEVQQKLKENPAQTRRMGIQYFQDNAAKFDGNIAPAIAAYHAGPDGAVKRAHEAATAKYGTTYSPEQFLEFLPAGLKDGNGKTTASYVRDIYTRMGAPTNAQGLSPMASYRASNAVGSVLDQQRAQSDAILANQVRVAGAQADEFAPLLQKGYLVQPQQIAAVQAPLQLAAARGDAGAQEKLTRFNEAMSVAPVVREAYSHRPEELETATAQMRQQLAIGGEASPAMARRLKVFEAVASEMASARKDNPIALAERQGMPATSINLEADPKSQEFGQQIMARSVVAQRAQAAYGGEHQFFRPEERVAAKARFEAAGEDERFNILSALWNNTRNEDVFNAAVKEITGGDKTATTAGMFMQRSPDVARDILRGSALLQQDGVKTKVPELKDAVKAAFGGNLYPPGVQASLLDAALAVYAAERGKNGALYDPADRAGMEAAIERVTGKITTINGGRVPLPAGISPGKASEAMAFLKPEHLAPFGGAHDRNGQPLDARFVARNARLIPMDVGGGKFQLVLGPPGREKSISTKDGGDLIIDLPAILKAQQFVPNATPGEMLGRRKQVPINPNLPEEDLHKLKAAP